jgi:CPA2 family monovalent cation:H+ antiporter-2
VLVRAHDPGARAQLVSAGAHGVVEPEAEAAAALIQHALGQLALPPERILAYLERFRFAMDATLAAEPSAPASGLPQVVEVLVESGPLVHGSLRDGRIRERFGVSVVALRRADGDVVLHPSPETVLRPGDRVRVFGLPSQIAAFLSDLRAPA